MTILKTIKIQPISIQMFTVGIRINFQLLTVIYSTKINSAHVAAKFTNTDAMCSMQQSPANSQFMPVIIDVDEG